MSGYAVTQRITSVKQPRGGYIPPKTLTPVTLGTRTTLAPEENIHPGLMGTVVDSLTRFASGTAVEHAFNISLIGASVVREEEKALGLARGIRGLDTASIISAIRLCGYDVAYRAGVERFVPVGRIRPDAATVDNVRVMVERALRFLAFYGPKTADGFTFEGGYTETVPRGDGDFLTADTLWDFKVSKNPPTKDHTLQVLMYWRMGLRSVHPEFQSIRHLGLYNPRLDTVYRIATSEIPESVIREVETEVIGYAAYTQL